MKETKETKYILGLRSPGVYLGYGASRRFDKHLRSRHRYPSRFPVRDFSWTKLFMPKISELFYYRVSSSPLLFSDFVPSIRCK